MPLPDHNTITGLQIQEALSEGFLSSIKRQKKTNYDTSSDITLHDRVVSSYQKKDRNQYPSLGKQEKTINVV
jgi:hypothetical protein